MSDNNNLVGTIGWFDITVNNAANLTKFYNKVVGWEIQPFSMGDYDDFIMTQPGTGTPIAGICHATGANSGLPNSWILYITVADLEKSITQVLLNGGIVITDVRRHDDIGIYAVIQDSEGGVVALYQNLKQ